MRVGYLECFAGVSGDMMLGALVDAGVPREVLEAAAASLGLGVELRVSRVDRSGIRAVKVDVLVGGVSAELAGVVGDPASSGGVGLLHSQEHGHSHSDEHSHAHDHADGHGNKTAAAAHSHEQSHRDINERGHVHGRGLNEIRALIEGAGLGSEATALALRTFELLAQSESKVHGVPVETIHFHEVGAVDAIVDIVCSAVGLCSLGVDRWVCSTLNVGGGFVDCAHGRFPVPAPATADLLRGAPTYSSGIAMELVTPTGAALVRALGCTFSDSPLMAVTTIGYGAGSRDPKRFPNVLRLSIGEAVEAVRGGGVQGAESESLRLGSNPFSSEMITVLECAVDDMNPQVVANAAALALERGALDVMSSSVTMKKGRLGTLITLLCRQERAVEFEELLFRETSTLGVRVRQEQRVYLERRMVEVETRYGLVRVKVASSRGEQLHAQPEYEDCRRLAVEAGVPLKEVIDAARLAFAESAHSTAGKLPGAAKIEVRA